MPTVPQLLDTSMPQQITPVHVLLFGGSVLVALLWYGRRVARTELLRLRERLLVMGAENDLLRVEVAVTRDETRQSRNLASLARIAAALNQEIGQPITAMGNYLAVARRQNTADTDRQALYKLGGTVARLQSVVTQLKTFSRPGSRSIRPVGVGELVIASVTKATPLAQDADIELILIVDAAAHAVRVSADAVRLQQVVDTLIRVALDAAPPSSTGQAPVTFVIVNVVHDASAVVMRVTGADGSQMRARTDLTADCGTGTREEGPEIAPGLAICGEIVKEHGGRLLIGTSGDLHCCFEMRLPCRVDPNAEARG